jgi:hypothetical protein
MDDFGYEYEDDPYFYDADPDEGYWDDDPNPYEGTYSED